MEVILGENRVEQSKVKQSYLNKLAYSLGFKLLEL